MEPVTKDRDFMQFRLDSAARQFADDTNEEGKDSDMQMSLNSLVPSIDNRTFNGENGDYFPILALPRHNLDLVFSSLSPKDRLALAGVNKELNKIESESKHYVKSLAIFEIPSIPAPLPVGTKNWFKYNKYDHTIVLYENRTYSPDFIRRIGHNVSIGELCIMLTGSSEFHREICNLLKDIDIGALTLKLENWNFASEMMVDSFVVDLTRCCKDLCLSYFYRVPQSTILSTKVYQIMLEGSAKIRRFRSPVQYIPFFNLIGITYRDGTFLSHRTDIEVYKIDHVNRRSDFHFFGISYLEMKLHMPPGATFNPLCVVAMFPLEIIRHETRESFEKAKNKEGFERIEIFPE